MNRRRIGPRPRVLGQPRPGVRRHGRGAGPAHGGRGRRDRALRRPHRPQDRPRPPQPDRARVRGAAPARRLRVHDPLRHPALRRPRDERGGDRRRPRRGRLDLRARRRPAGRGDAAGGPSGQRRGGAAGRLRALQRRPRGALRPAARPGVPARRARRRPCARPRRARRCRRGSRSRTRSSTSPTPRCSCSASPAATSAWSRAGSATASTSRAARTSIRARGSWSRPRSRSARWARRSPAPGRPCSSGATSSPPSAVAAQLHELAEGWAEVLRVPFAATGADVRSL